MADRGVNADIVATAAKTCEIRRAGVVFARDALRGCTIGCRT